MHLYTVAQFFFFSSMLINEDNYLLCKESFLDFFKRGDILYSKERLNVKKMKKLTTPE